MAKLKDHKPQLLSIKDVGQFFEQIGRNTGYIIHPEEILAENFALLLSGSSELETPELIQKIKRLLLQQK